ncbi:MAG: YbjQ family protein [Verrucomicrobiales bacterium]
MRSCSTTGTVPGRELVETMGIVSGEAIMGANIFRDIAADVRDLVGGQSRAYEGTLRAGRDAAMAQMVEQVKAKGCNAAIGVSIDYETVGKSMLMVVATGTAALVE